MVGAVMTCVRVVGLNCKVGCPVEVIGERACRGDVAVAVNTQGVARRSGYVLERPFVVLY